MRKYLFVASLFFLALAQPQAGLAATLDQPGKGVELKPARATWNTGFFQEALVRRGLEELGYKGVVVESWNGFFAPKGTPQPIIKLLNEQLNAIVHEPEVAKKLAVFGALPKGGPPSVLTQLNRQEYEVMGKAIRELGISGD